MQDFEKKKECISSLVQETVTEKKMKPILIKGVSARQLSVHKE